VTRRAWQDLLPHEVPKSPTVLAPPLLVNTSVGELDAVNLPGGFDPSTISPRLSELFAERDHLEREMRHLSGGDSQITARDAARFALSPRSERVAEYEQWLLQRDRSHSTRESTRSSNAGPGAETGPALAPFRGRELGPAGTAARSALSRISGADIDRQLEASRSVVDGSSFGEVAGRTLRGDYREALRDRRRSAASQARRSRGQEATSTARSALDTPRPWERLRQPTRKVADDWAKRRDATRNEMKRVGSYVENSRQVLSILEGGSGSFEERAERAIEKLAEKRITEAEDQNRRDRALANRRAREAEQR